MRIVTVMRRLGYFAPTLAAAAAMTLFYAYTQALFIAQNSIPLTMLFIGLLLFTLFRLGAFGTDASQ